jgi:hypothetical protein
MAKTATVTILAQAFDEPYPDEEMTGTFGYIFDRYLSSSIEGNVRKNLTRLPPSTAVSTTPHAHSIIFLTLSI